MCLGGRFKRMGGGGGMGMGGVKSNMVRHCQEGGGKGGGEGGENDEVKLPAEACGGLQCDKVRLGGAGGAGGEKKDREVNGLVLLYNLPNNFKILPPPLPLFAAAAPPYPHPPPPPHNSPQLPLTLPLSARTSC
jgi:hypothetical protein